ncbi:hypothetical protein NL676_029401 [Syzygium grande]|nr:hypothetical protein NL676_029401 [Syzygium grande]
MLMAQQPPQVTEAILHQVAASLQMYLDELPQMPKLLGYTLDTGSPEPGGPTIGMYETRWKFHRDLPATTVFANGTSAQTASVPGPTIEAIQDVSTGVTWENHLPSHTYCHGTPLFPPQPPSTEVSPRSCISPAGFNPPNRTAVLLLGSPPISRRLGQPLGRPNCPYVLRDPAFDAKMNLPVGLEFDHHLMIFERSFYKDGSLYLNYTGDNPTIHPQWQPECFREAIIANGKAWPYLLVQRRKYRFHIINVSNARCSSLALANGLLFTMVGSDSSYLASPVTTQRILLSPAETFDVVVDFSAATTTESILTNDAPYPYPNGTQPDQLMGQVMKFIIKPGAPSPPDTSCVPASLAPSQAATIVGASLTRYITLYEYLSSANLSTHRYINGKCFLDPVMEKPKSGSTEVWEVINLIGDNHPLHIHLATFRAIKVQQLVDEQGFLNCMTSKNDAVACNVTGHATGPTLSTFRLMRGCGRTSSRSSPVTKRRSLCTSIWLNKTMLCTLLMPPQLQDMFTIAT